MKIENYTIIERHLASILADVLTEHKNINMDHEAKLLERIGIDWRGMLANSEAMDTASEPSWRFSYNKMLSFVDEKSRSRIEVFEDEIYDYI